MQVEPLAESGLEEEGSDSKSESEQVYGTEMKSDEGSVMMIKMFRKNKNHRLTGLVPSQALPAVRGGLLERY